MYNRQRMGQEAKAIVKAIADRRENPRNTSLPNPELMYWNMASQLDGQRREFD